MVVKELTLSTVKNSHSHPGGGNIFFLTSKLSTAIGNDVTGDRCDISNYKCSAFDLKDNTQILLLVGLDSLSRIVENCENIPTFKIQSREIYTIKPHTDFQEICGKTLLRLAGAWSRKKSFMIKMSLQNGELHAETRLSCHI